MWRFLSYIFMLAGLAALAYDVWRGPFKEAPLEFTSTSDHWLQFHPESLSQFNAFIEQSVSPELWSLGILPAISWPAFVLFAIIGLVLLTLAGRQNKPTGREGLMFSKGRR